MSLMRRGALFAGALYAGMLFGPAPQEADASQVGTGWGTNYAELWAKAQSKAFEDAALRRLEEAREEEQETAFKTAAPGYVPVLPDVYTPGVEEIEALLREMLARMRLEAPSLAARIEAEIAEQDEAVVALLMWMGEA